MIMIGYLLIIIYALLSLVAAFMGKKQTKLYATIIMMVGSILLISSSVLLLLNLKIIGIVLLIIGIILIQLVAISNGYILYKKLNIKHQISRLIFGVIIVLLILL